MPSLATTNADNAEPPIQSKTAEINNNNSGKASGTMLDVVNMDSVIEPPAYATLVFDSCWNAEMAQFGRHASPSTKELAMVPITTLRLVHSGMYLQRILKSISKFHSKFGGELTRSHDQPKAHHTVPLEFSDIELDGGDLDGALGCKYVLEDKYYGFRVSRAESMHMAGYTSERSDFDRFDYLRTSSESSASDESSTSGSESSSAYSSCSSEEEDGTEAETESDSSGEEENGTTKKTKKKKKKNTTKKTKKMTRKKKSSHSRVRKKNGRTKKAKKIAMKTNSFHCRVTEGCDFFTSNKGALIQHEKWCKELSLKARAERSGQHYKQIAKHDEQNAQNLNVSKTMNISSSSSKEDED